MMRYPVLDQQKRQAGKAASRRQGADDLVAGLFTVAELFHGNNFFESAGFQRLGIVAIGDRKPADIKARKRRSAASARRP